MAARADIPDRVAAALRACGIPEPYHLRDNLSGGGINQAFAVDTGAGPVFVKVNAAAPPDFFAREREGLETLAAAGSPLVIPKVLGLHAPDTGPSALTLEWLEPVPPPASAGAGSTTWETLGRGLADLHRSTGDAFGFGADNYLGATPQLNGWSGSWARFFAERRIGYLAGLLYRSGTLTVEALRLYERLLEKLPDILNHDPAPSLLHGDLWNGNFLATARGPALIDPAVYYGDRETDLAMMRLFGGFPETVFDAYREAWPLPHGWKDREPIYRLYHLLNHQFLFGGSYGVEAVEVAKGML